MASLTYHEQKDIENIKKLRGLIKELPPFCADFFRGIEPLTVRYATRYSGFSNSGSTS